MSVTLSFSSQVPVGIPLSSFTNAITNTVHSSPNLSGVWVIAELSDVRLAGGHCYMELIEKNEAGVTVAKLRATIWKSNYNLLRQKFFNATGRDITNGIKALIKGSATHHSLYGLSFNIYDIDPSYTMGDLERLRSEIIRKLQMEGVADYNRNLPFPMAPQRIAVISAEGAAGYGDFMNHLCENSEGFVFYTRLFPCIMQGERISESIRGALEFIEATIDLWDCVVIIRGGGATTDLNGFDEYQLARSVAIFPLPVVVGIGHERDRNVLDELANTSLKTPTAVAGFFIDKAREAYDNILVLADRIRYQSTEMMKGEERRLSSLGSLMPQLALNLMNKAQAGLKALTGKVPILVEGKIAKERVKISGMGTILGNVSSGRIDKERVKINSNLNLLISFSKNSIDQARSRLSSLESILNVLDPKNTLKRGYSITRINGKAVKSISEISKGDFITSVLPDGEIQSRV